MLPEFERLVSATKQRWADRGNPRAGVRDLAKAVCDSAEFATFADRLFAPHSHHWAASNLLQRSGFYHGITSGLATPELWAAVEPYTLERQRELWRLVLLDRCAFAKDSFELLGFKVVRFNKEQLARLGPSSDVVRDFHPSEGLDAAWFAQQWFLYEVQFEKVSPRSIHVPFWGGDYTLKEFWAPLLLLGLYDTTCFRIPIVLEAEPGWIQYRPKFGTPDVVYSTDLTDPDDEAIEVPSTDYEVTTKESSQFDAFVALAGRSVRHCESWRGFRIAARRYLRATFLSTPSGEATDDDDREDIFLQYIFALEAILTGGIRVELQNRLATTAALLVGQNDADRKRIVALIKAAYAARSGIAHGGEAGADLDLPAIRSLFRDVMLAFMSIAPVVGTQEKTNALLGELPISVAAQRQVQQSFGGIRREAKPYVA